jgi:predicted RNase H-like HicB family nuclease
MHLDYTAVFQRVPEGYIGFIEELPGANVQAATLDEARADLVDAARLVLETNRELLQQELDGDVIREPLRISAA